MIMVVSTVVHFPSDAEQDMSDPNVEAARAMLRVRVASQGLRNVAREVGMSDNGLRQFLGGTRPVLPTRRKVLAWRRRYVEGDLRTDEEVLVDELLAARPAARRPALRRRLLALLADDDGPGDAPPGDADPRGCVVLQPVFHLDFRTCAHPAQARAGA
jgi:hypothetical protein